MSNFISNFVNNHPNPMDLFTLAKRIFDFPMTTVEHVVSLEPDRSLRYEAYNELIRAHLPDIVNTEFKPEYFQPQEQVKSWDDYIGSLSKMLDKLPDQMSKTFQTATNEAYAKCKELKHFNDESFSRFKKIFIEFLEKGVIEGGINTGLHNLFGFIRVIPILFNELKNRAINKSELIKLLCTDQSKKLLQRFMVLEQGSMVALSQNLWQQPVNNTEDAKEKMEDQDPLLMQFQAALSENSKLWHPNNFKLTEDGLNFNESGEHYYKAADQLRIDDKLGCPAVHVDDVPMSQGMRSATEAICELVVSFIQKAIPDEQFGQLMEADRKSIAEIRRGFNAELDRCQKEVDALRRSYL